MIMDLGSQAGTYKKIIERVELKHGAAFQLGSTTIDIEKRADSLKAIVNNEFLENK